MRPLSLGRLRMSETLNVYWHEDGHYLFVPGPPVDSMRGAKIAWLGTMQRECIGPALRRGIEEQLQFRTCAMITAAQFYAPSHAHRAETH